MQVSGLQGGRRTSFSNAEVLHRLQQRLHLFVRLGRGVLLTPVVIALVRLEERVQPVTRLTTPYGAASPPSHAATSSTAQSYIPCTA